MGGDSGGHTHPAQIGAFQFLAIEIINDTVIHPLIDPKSIPCRSTRPIEGGPEIIGNRRVGISGGETGAPLRLQSRIVRIVAKKARGRPLPRAVIEGRPIPTAFRPSPIRIRRIQPVFPSTGKIHDRQVQFFLIGGQGFRQSRLRHPRGAPGIPARPPIPPVVHVAILIDNLERVPCPIGRQRPVAPVPISQDALHRPGRILEHDRVPGIVQGTGPWPHDAHRRRDRRPCRPGGRLIGTAQDESSVFIQKMGIGTGRRKSRERPCYPVTQGPTGRIGPIARQIGDFDVFRLSGRRIVHHLREDHLPGLEGGCEKKERDEKRTVSTHGSKRRGSELI